MSGQQTHIADLQQKLTEVSLLETVVEGLFVTLSVVVVLNAFALGTPAMVVGAYVAEVYLTGFLSQSAFITIVSLTPIVLLATLDEIAEAVRNALYKST